MEFLESYPPPPLTSEEIFSTVVFFVVLGVLFLLRKLPIFNVVWYVVKWFFITLLIVLGTNFAKGEIKKWWDK